MPTPPNTTVAPVESAGSIASVWSKNDSEKLLELEPSIVEPPTVAAGVEALFQVTPSSEDW